MFSDNWIRDLCEFRRSPQLFLFSRGLDVEAFLVDLTKVSVTCRLLSVCLSYVY